MNRPALSDLLAVATVRTLLLELGHEFVPGDEVGVAAKLGSLEVLVHTPHPLLDGRTPMDLLRDEGGQVQLRRALEQLLKHDSTPSASTEQGVQQSNEQEQQAGEGG